MKNKLKLAIISIILQFVLSLVLNGLYRWAFTSDGFGAGAANMIYFLVQLCSLGTLPFFIALYRSKDFNTLMAKEGGEEGVKTPDKDQNWIRHFLIRFLVVAGLCLAFGSITLWDRGLGAAYLMVYGIVTTMGVSAVVLFAEALYRLLKKQYYKAAGNLTIIILELIFLFQLL